MAREKLERAAWVVVRYGRVYRVVETASGWIWRTLATPAEATQWIKDATAHEDRRGARS